MPTSTSEQKKLFKELWQQVGNTPFATIRYRYRQGPEQTIIAKCEYDNISGSIEDRVALYLLQQACEQGKLQDGKPLKAALSTQFLQSLKTISQALGHPLEISALFGDFNERIMAEAYEKTTGREIGYYLLLKRTVPQAFAAGVGSGATLIGIGKYLRNLFPDMAVHPLATDEQNLSALPKLSAIIKVDSKDAALLTQKINTELKLPVGTTSGLNLLGAIELQHSLERGSTVVTVFPDRALKPLPKLPIHPDHSSPHIELTSCELSGRERHVHY